MRPRRRRHRRARARHRPPAVRAQRRTRPRRARRCLRRLRGQRADVAHPDEAGAQDRGQWVEPHPCHAGRREQVPLGARAGGAQVRRLRRGRPRARLGARGRSPAAAVPGGADHGLGRRRGLLRARRGGRPRLRPDRPRRAGHRGRARRARRARRPPLRRRARRAHRGGAGAVGAPRGGRRRGGGGHLGGGPARVEAPDERAGGPVRASPRPTPPAPRTATPRSSGTPPTSSCPRRRRPRWRC